MPKLGDKVVYPVYGVGIVSKEYQEEINGEKKDYIEIRFEKSQIDVAVPKESATGVRYREKSSKEDLSKSLKNIGKKVSITNEMLGQFDKIIKDKLQTGNIDEYVDLVNILQAKKNIKGKMNLSESKYYENIKDFLEAEIELVMGKEGLKTYSIPAK